MRPIAASTTFIDGFARHMREALPNASFIGFTGTPIELTDKNTRAVFGDYGRVSPAVARRASHRVRTCPIKAYGSSSQGFTAHGSTLVSLLSVQHA
jgi:hypothetical protein